MFPSHERVRGIMLSRHLLIPDRTTLSLPYAETVFDYTRRAMPFDNPGSLTDDEVYAVVAWMLPENQVIEKTRR